MSNADKKETPLVGRPSLTRFAWLSIGAALATLVLKTGAYLLTGSVGLLSDAVGPSSTSGATMALGC
jgi:divalent metal cation (Fe/Co/Zn/Cd) transporter